jgi:hypothetical protein
MYFKEIANSTVLQIVVPLGIIMVVAKNTNGLFITRYINALARSLLNTTRIAAVWIVGVIVTVTAGKHDEAYRWEKLSPWGIVVQSIGFSLLIVATLLYN